MPITEVPEFQPWPKIPRMRNEHIVITEKLDGTNAQVLITPEGNVFAGSRSRWIFPGKNTDNYGFAAWVEDHKSELLKLGHGRFFGEWYGYGIGPRGYGLPDRRWALFNTFRPKETLPSCVEQVTVLYEGPGIRASALADDWIDKLNNEGSVHVPGYMKPEGIVIYSSLSRSRTKRLCEGDDAPKPHPSPEE